MQEEQPGISRTNFMLFLLLGFFVVFNISAVIIQNLSGEAPNAHGTIVDIFTGSILWMASIIALLTAVKRYPDTRRALLCSLREASRGFSPNYTAKSGVATADHRAGGATESRGWAESPDTATDTSAGSSDATSASRSASTSSAYPGYARAGTGTVYGTASFGDNATR